jgi:adenosine deaminase
MDLSGFPKIEIHLHLDCSLSYEVANTLVPSLTKEQYRRDFIAPPKCRDLADYLVRAEQGFKLMQDRQALHLVTHDLFDQLAADEVIYAEIRFAPLLHTLHGMTPEAVVEAVLEAGREAEVRTGIVCRFILCTLRSHAQTDSMRVVKLVERYLGQGVGGFDIAGNEAGFDLSTHLPAFEYAYEHAIPVTMHAGEARGADSVRESVEQGHTRRLGHGVRAVEDSSLLDWLLEHKVHFEVCPTSNVQTDVVAALPDHPIRELVKMGQSVSVNTDGRTLSGVSLTDEYRSLQRVFGWQADDFLRANREALRVAFLAEAEKTKLRQKLDAGYS